MERKTRLGFAFAVLAIFIIGMTAFALAEQKEGKGRLRAGPPGSGNSEGADDESPDDLQVELSAEDMNSAAGEKLNLRAGNVDDCIQRVNGLLPKVTEDKARNACVKALDNKEEMLSQIRTRAEERKENRLGNGTGNFTGERKEMRGNGELKNKVMKKVAAKEILRARDILKNKMEDAQKAFMKAKDEYVRSKNKHLEARDGFLELKGKYKGCNNANSSVNSSLNCTEVEEKLIAKAKEDLMALTDRLIDHLDKIKSKIEGAENMNQTEADAAIAEIDALTKELTDEQALIEAADTKAEIQDVTAKIKATWKKIDFSARQYAERVIRSEVGQIFSRSTLLEARLQAVIDKLNDKGVNTTAMQATFDEFKAKIDSARNKMTAANDKYAEAKELRSENKTEEAKAALEAAKDLTSEAHADLKEAHNLLLEMVKEMNQKGESFKADAIDDNELVEVEVEN